MEDNKLTPNDIRNIKNIFQKLKTSIQEGSITNADVNEAEDLVIENIERILKKSQT